MTEKVRYTVSNVIQNDKKFYSLTVPTDVLARCCFVSTRDEDPEKGFQRTLDKKRAQQIAEYIDNNNGTIPSSIILSAQPEAQINITGKGRTIEFTVHPKSFLILDGQHRVYGFSMSKKNLRVPVVIYNELSRKDESRLFIDINSKQKGVPSELLLDIKRMAEYENTTESLLRDIFDLFLRESSSILIGKLSPASKSKNKISRVTFNSAITPITKFFGNHDEYELFDILNAYLASFKEGLFKPNNLEEQMLSTVIFRAVFSIFPEVAGRVKDRFGSDYTVDNFLEIISPMCSGISLQKIKKPGSSYKQLSEHFLQQLKSTFTL